MAPRKAKLLFPAVFSQLALYYTLPFLLKYNFWGVRDWDMFTTLAAVPVGTIVHYGQFPFWNPFLGGGNILFHHPQVGVLTPFLLLHLIFGVVVGLKLQVLICYFLGFWGSHRLATSLGISRWAALMTTVAYFGSVHLALHFAEGHITFTHFGFLPWFVYFVLRSCDDKRKIIYAGVVLALIVLGHSAAVVLLYTLTFSVLFFGLRSLETKKIIHLKHLIYAVLAGVGLAAVKFVPMVVHLAEAGWQGEPNESIPISALGSIFFGLKHSLFVRNFPQQHWAWHEYGAYISPLLVLLGVVALMAHFRRHRIWLVIALFFLLLGLGNFGRLSPWALLSHLPGFYSARGTGRAFHFVILSVSILGGFGFDFIKERISGCRREKLMRQGLNTAAGIVILTNLLLVWPIMSSAFTQEPKEAYRSPVFTHVVEEESSTYENYLANRGSLITPWVPAYRPSRGLVGPDSSVFMEHVLRGEASVRRRHYTPNRIEYQLDGQRAGELAISMGFDPGWKALDGRPLRDEQGLIAFPFDRGPQQVVLQYRPPYMFAGLAISVATLLALIILRRRW